MADLKWKPKDPTDVADYKVNWTPSGKRFLPDGVTITASVFTLAAQEPPDPGFEELEIVQQDHTDTLSVVRFAGGTDKRSYPVDVDIDVSTGEHFNTTLTLPVKERIKT
jgi:hypothetical protein